MLADDLASHVGGHDDDTVLEVHHAALAIGEPSVIEHLQQDVEHVGMGLLHLVEQHHAVGIAAHGFGELAALVVAHVSRRRSDQALHGELLHVLGHVDAYHGLLGIEQVLGQRLGQLGLAHAGGAEEQERANGTVRVGKSRTVAADGTGHDTHGLVLADDAALQNLFQIDELFHLALHHLGHGDARPGGHNGGDLLFGNLFLQDSAVLLLHLHGFLGHVQLLLQLRNARVANLGGELQVALAGGALLIELSAFELGLEVLHANDGVLLVLPLGLLGIERFLGGRDVVAQLLQALLGGHVGLLHEGLLLDLHLDELALGGVHLFRHGVDLDAQAAGRFVHEVDGLVGQEAIGDVAVGQLRRAHDGAVGDAHAVMDLVLLLQAAQDGDGVLHRGLAHQHRLEAALQGGILLDVFAILVQGGGTDGAQLAASQSRLQHVARIQRRIAAGAGTHDSVQLVDEQDDVAISLLHLTQHVLQTVLELAAVLRAGHHRTQIERDDLAILQRRGHVAGHDALGQTLDDSGFAGAGLADEHRVVLRTARQHLNGTANLLVTADNRIELALAGLLGEVLAVLLQRFELGLVGLRGHAGVAAQALVGRLDVLAGDARRGEDATRGTLVLGQGNEQVLARRVAVTELLGDLHRVVDDLDKVLARDGHGSGAGLLGHLGNLVGHVLGQPDRVGADALHDSGEVVLVGIEQRLQQVNGLDNGGIGLTSNAHRVLESLLRRHRQFI